MVAKDGAGHESMPAEHAPEPVAAVDADATDEVKAKDLRKGKEPIKHETRVIIRIRPPGKHEVQHITCDDHVGSSMHAEKPEPYDETFGCILGTKCSQHECYIACGTPMIASALKGRNSLLFAYGQSGAGKTFSMYGAEGGKNPSKLDGVVPATVAELFRRTTAIEKESVGAIKFSLGASLVEVQNKWIFDLLQEPGPDGMQPPVRPALHLIGAPAQRRPLLSWPFGGPSIDDGCGGEPSAARACFGGTVHPSERATIAS